MKTIHKFPLFVLLLSIFSSTVGQKPSGNILSYSDTYYSVRDKFGKVKKGEKLNDSTFRDEYVSFEQDGKIIHLTEYNPDGSIYRKFKGRYGFGYNNIESLNVLLDLGTKIEQRPFLIESVKYSWGEKYEMTYKNDINGHPIEETIYDLFGRVLFKIILKRDEYGHLVEDNCSDGTVNRYTYDARGNRIEWIYRSSNKHFIITTYKYDVYGNIIEMNVTNSFKSVFKYYYDNFNYTYRYDERGNWVERTDFEFDKPCRIVERRIEYSSSN